MTTMTQKEFISVLTTGGKFPAVKLCVDGHLDLTGSYLPSFAKSYEFPNNLTIRGDLWVWFENPKPITPFLLKMPKKLVVRGGLFVFGRKVLMPKDVLFRDICACFAAKGHFDYYTREAYNRLCRDELKERVYFLREKIITLQKLIEIPELWDEVYYAHKSDFMALLKRI